MHPYVAEQVEVLQKCQAFQRGIHAKIADQRKVILDLEAANNQADDNLKSARSAAQQEALMDETLTNDTKRKAAVEKKLAECPDVKAATKALRDAQHQLAVARIDLDKITDQRRAAEYAQTAAGYIIQAHQQEGTAHVASTRQQPTTHHTNGR